MRKRIFFIFIVLAAFVFTGGALAQDDPRDRIPALLNNVLEMNKTGEAISWSNAATGNSGEITITKTYIMGRDTDCRDYARTTKFSNGGGFEVTGTGCRNKTGVWNLEEGAPKNIDVAKAPAKAPVKAPAKAPAKVSAKASAKASAPAKKPSPPTVKKPHVEAKALKKIPVSLGGTVPSKSDDY